MTFGERLTNMRKSKGLSQEQLAQELDLTRQTISKWELDQSTPDLEYIVKLSDFYGVTTDHLIKGEPSGQKSDANISRSGGLKIQHVLLSLAGMVAGVCFIGLFALVVCAALRPISALVNGVHYEGLMGFLRGSKTLWLFITLAVLAVLSAVAFGYGVVKTFLGKKGN